mgnify:CR=1 FL=1
MLRILAGGLAVILAAIAATAVIIARANERLRRSRKAALPERPSWQTDAGRGAAPRLRFGL